MIFVQNILDFFDPQESVNTPMQRTANAFVNDFFFTFDKEKDLVPILNIMKIFLDQAIAQKHGCVPREEARNQLLAEALDSERAALFHKLQDGHDFPLKQDIKTTLNRFQDLTCLLQETNPSSLNIQGSYTVNNDAKLMIAYERANDKWREDKPYPDPLFLQRERMDLSLNAQDIADNTTAAMTATDVLFKDNNPYKKEIAYLSERDAHRAYYYLFSELAKKSFVAPEYQIDDLDCNLNKLFERGQIKETPAVRKEKCCLLLDACNRTYKAMRTAKDFDRPFMPNPINLYKVTPHKAVPKTLHIRKRYFAFLDC